MTRYLHHVTLSTGHSRRSYRSEVTDEAVAHVRQLIARARDDGRAALDGPAAHCTLTVAAEGGALLATIAAPLGPHLPGRAHGGDTMPLVTVAVPRKSKSAPRLWEMITASAGNPHALVRPPAPWCAVWLREDALAAFPDAAEWLGDIERLIAWAWIEWSDE